MHSIGINYSQYESCIINSDSPAYPLLPQTSFTIGFI